MNIIESCPAYDVVEPVQTHNDAIVLRAGDRLAVYDNAGYKGDHGLAYVGSVAAFALKNDMDPSVLLDKARTNKEELVWINLEATSLTAEPQGRRLYFAVHLGQWVYLEGNYYYIKAAPNRNFKFRSIG